MRVGGRKIQGPKQIIVVIPRPTFKQSKVDELGQPIHQIGSDNQPIVDDDNNPIPEVEEVSGDIVFKAEAVLSYKPFEDMVPQPLPPKVIRRGESASIPDLEDPKYKDAFMRWARLQTDWLMITSLRSTEGLEWETVNYADPDTWHNYIKDFENAGFSTPEVSRILQGIMEANGLNDEVYDEAKKRFLAGLERKQ